MIENQEIYNPDFIKKLFNRMSDSYERMNYITSFGFSIRWRKQLVKKITPSKSNLEIADLLTGMGETWQTINKWFPDGNITALDFSERMLYHAKIRNANNFNNEVKIVNQDILNNTLPSNYFDIVICAFGLKTFNENQLNELSKEVNRILKHNGQFSFIEVSEPNNTLLYSLYKFYLKYIIPLFGKLLLGNPEEYRMLWKYTDYFKNAKSAKSIFEKTGLTTSYHSYFFGCATGFSGIKTSSTAPPNSILD